MKKIISIMLVMIVLCVYAGCGGGVDKNGGSNNERIDEINKKYEDIKEEYNKKLEQHEASVMQKDGIWEERYSDCNYDSNQQYAVMQASVLEKKKMTEEQRMDVLDYYKLKTQSLNDIGDSDYYNGDTVCYVVFYFGDDFEETARYKYVNGEVVDIPEDEESMFIDSIFNGRY